MKIMQKWIIFKGYYLYIQENLPKSLKNNNYFRVAVWKSTATETATATATATKTATETATQKPQLWRFESHFWRTADATVKNRRSAFEESQSQLWKITTATPQKLTERNRISAPRHVKAVLENWPQLWRTAIATPNKLSGMEIVFLPPDMWKAFWLVFFTQYLLKHNYQRVNLPPSPAVQVHGSDPPEF